MRFIPYPASLPGMRPKTDAVDATLAPQSTLSKARSVQYRSGSAAAPGYNPDGGLDFSLLSS